MLGKRDPQRDFFNAASRFAPSVERLGFYGKLAEEGHRIFRDSDFASCYSKIGRPSAPPSLVALARLLQYHEGVSDDEVIERLKYDLRWKVALDLDPLSMTAPFVKSTFQGFRARLTLHAKEGLAFEKSVKAAREAGLLSKRLCSALDSSPIRGRGAVKDTFNLMSDAIREVVTAIAAKRERTPREEAAAIGVERHFDEASIKGTELVNWDDEAEKSKFLAGLLEDSEKVVAAARKAKCGADEVELLERVIEQDVDPTGDGPSIRDGVAKDRVISASDPEMRHGHKSNGKVYNGHKAHVAVEVESGIITAIDVTAPSEPDGSKVAELVGQTEKLTGLPVEQVLGDTAYSSRTAVEQAAQAEVELATKMPSPREGFFGPGDFKVSKDGKTARCPAGHESSKHAKADDGTRHSWPRELCGDCPFKAQCTKADYRQLLVPPDFHDRRRREREARSKRGRTRLKKRVAAEHAIGRLKNMGAGAARYFGREKTRAQWQWSAAVVNLSNIWSREAALERDAAAAAA